MPAVALERAAGASPTPPQQSAGGSVSPVAVNHFVRAVIFAMGLVLAGAGRLAAQEEPLVITNPAGVTATFSMGNTGWRWSTLAAPRAPEGGWAIAEEGIVVATPEREDWFNRGWNLVEQHADRLILEQAGADTGLRVRRVFAFGPASNVLRVETWVQSPAGRSVVARIGLLDVQIAGESFRETGLAPASFPAFGQNLFAGIEHVSGECTVLGEAADRVQLQHRPRLAVEGTWQLVAAAIVGWSDPALGTGLTGAGALREAFLHYLDTVRLKPDRIVLHTDTWWTVPLPLNEKNVLADIDTLRTAFHGRTGMFFDTYCVDLGWSNPRTLWQVDSGAFPSELRAVQERLAGAGGRLGLWLSPGSGYAEGLSNSWLQSQGYETMPFAGPLGQVPCFALGNRYQREVKERLVAHARQYELGHVILDFMPLRCDVATHGHPVGPESRYAIDAGLADVLDALRAVNPGIVLEPMVCGYPPSPWWLMKTPFVLGPAGDDMPYGRSPSPDWLESLVTARDVVYRASQESWLMPTQALETFDIIVLTPGAFANTAVMAIGRGRWFLSTYFKSSLMRPEDWDFLAAMVRWARQNKQHLVNAWQFGGRPENREAYGYMFRDPAKNVYCVRNPWMEEQTITLPTAVTASGGAVDVRMIYPRRTTVGRIEPGERGPSLVLGPYETVLLETQPAAETTPEVAPVAAPRIETSALPPRMVVEPALDPEREHPILRYAWGGTLHVPEISEGELCVLIEGDRTVDRATCRITLGNQQVQPRLATSVGQFGAAIEPSPENWAWFIVPLTRGDTKFEIEIAAAQAEVAVGVFVRGVTAAPSDPEPEGVAVFPTVRPNVRAWSQTLQPMRKIPAPSEP